MPGNASIADTLGWAFFRRKEYAKAVEILARTVVPLANSPTARYHLGAALHGSGRMEEAEHHLEAALALADDFGDADHARTLLASIREQTEKQSETQ
jgi:Flp pilus assembly protein TadD